MSRCDRPAPRLGNARWVLPALVALLACPSVSWAQAGKWDLQNVTFGGCEVSPGTPCNSGGQAIGYFVLPENWPLGQDPPDWAIYVSAGDEGVFAPFLYDPTTATANVVSGAPDIRPHVIFTSLDGRRSLRFELARIPTTDNLMTLATALSVEFIGELETVRQVSDGHATTTFAPVLILKVNDQHPGGRIVDTDGHVRLSLGLLPSAWTGAFDWYWAIVVNGVVYWITAAGLSLTPAPFLTQAPGVANDVVLLEGAFPPGTYTNVILLMDGSTLVTADYITARVGS